MQPEKPSPLGHVQDNRPGGSLSRRYREDMLALAASRDPLKAVELELLFGIRKWIEYGTAVALIGVIVVVYLGFFVFIRLVP